MKKSEKCPKCGALLKFVWENNGYEPPNPTKWEIVKVYCPECGWEK